MTTEVSTPPVTPIEAPSAVSLLGRIVALAGPLALGACVLSVLNLGTLALLSRHDQGTAFHTVSLLQPAFFVIIALMEALGVTNQVFAARTKRVFSRHGLRGSSWRLLIIGLGLILLLAAVAYGAANIFGPYAGTWEPVLAVLPYAILSMSAFVVFEVYHGALRGRGRILLGLVPFALAVMATLAAIYGLLTQYDLGLYAVLLGNFIGPFLMLPAIIYLVHREARGGEPMPAAALYGQLRGLLAAVGGPVFFSILVASASAAVIFPVLDRFGKEEVSAFLVIIRLRVAFMIPAVAAGSAIAILVNQSLDEKLKHGSSTRILAVGLPLIFVFYLLATLTIVLVPGMAVDTIVPQQTAALNDWSLRLLLLLLPTFFLLPCATCMQIVLEQVGDGAKVLVLTVLVEVATVCALLFALQGQQSIEFVCYVLIAAAGVTFIAFLGRILILSRRWEASNAV